MPTSIHETRIGLPTNFVVSHETTELVNSKLLSATKKAITLVWQRHISEPTIMEIIFSNKRDYRKFKDGLSLVLADYNPNADAFRFYMEPIQEELKKGMGLKELMIYLAGHEAMHKVQFHRDGDFPEAPYEMGSEGDYNLPHESEARAEGLEIVKHFYPMKREFILGNKSFLLPEKSKYDK